MTKDDAKKKAEQHAANIQATSKRNAQAAAHRLAGLTKESAPISAVRSRQARLELSSGELVHVTVYEASFGNESLETTDEAHAHAWLERRRAAWRESTAPERMRLDGLRAARLATKQIVEFRARQAISRQGGVQLTKEQEKALAVVVNALADLEERFS